MKLKIYFFIFFSFVLVANPAFAREKKEPRAKDFAPYLNANLNDETVLKKLLKLKGPLTSYLNLKLAEVDLQNPDEKKDKEVISLLLKDKDSPDFFNFWRRVLLSQAYLNLNQPREALKNLENFTHEPVVEMVPSQSFYRSLYRQALIIKAQALEKLGENSNSIAAQIWAFFPDMEDHFSPTPSYVSVLDKIKRLHVLNEKKLYDSIPSFITVDEIAQSDAPLNEKCQAFFEWGNSLRNSDSPEDALLGYGAAIKENCEGSPLIKSYYWKGKLEARLKRTDSAIETYNEFIKKFPHNSYTDDAYYALWKIYSNLNQDKMADEVYSDLINHTEGDMRSSALWDEAYDDYQNHDYSKAIQLFDKIISTKPGQDEFYPQALYWKARSLQKRASLNHGNSLDIAESKNLYHRILNDFPFSFYAILTSKRMGLPCRAAIIRPLNPTIPADVQIKDFATVIDYLSGAKQYKEAQEVADYFSQSDPEREAHLTTFLAKQWLKSGDYHQAMILAQNYFELEPKGVIFKEDSPMLLALYPLAFEDYVKVGSNKTGLSGAIFEGIMREESLFQPNIKSVAGAVGVMQLMPETARIQAKTIGIPEFETENLAFPQWNILIGSAYFKKVLEEFDGSLPLAIMAYNAGPGNVRKWLSHVSENVPLDEFIENIPFSETRGYVKRVLRSIHVYGHLLNEKELQNKYISMSLK